MHFPSCIFMWAECPWSYKASWRWPQSVPFSASDDWVANQNDINLLNNTKSNIKSAKQKSINATSGIIIKLKSLKNIFFRP
ncbi:unnamed protein product [Blepharisma stoltei]|uniref:Uncharacterized protein n=1 Tax=Blepharisma stoltei TaxID=1481888 RepID=A0AAU9J8S0_9CILI|nr:unnamed protein product [Blepharisma stoltei]